METPSVSKGPDYGGTAADRERDTMTPTPKPHSELSGFVGYTAREFEGSEWVREKVAEEMASRILSLEEQYEALREAAQAVSDGWQGIGWDERTKGPMARLRFLLSNPASEPKEK